MRNKHILPNIVFILLTFAQMISQTRTTYSAVSEEFKIEILSPEIGWVDLITLDTLIIQIQITNQGYISHTNSNKIHIQFGASCIEREHRIINGNWDTSTDDKLSYGRRGKTIEAPAIGESTTISHDINFKGRKFKPFNMYSLGYHVVIISCNEPEARPTIDILNKIAEKRENHNIFGPEYIDHIFTLMKDIDPDSMLYTENLGKPLSVVLEEGNLRELREYAEEKGVMYAWSNVEPKIDGVISEGEWDDADQEEIDYAIIYLKNDAENLYLALNVSDIFDEYRELLVKFYFSGNSTPYFGWEDAIRIIYNEGDCFEDLHYNYTDIILDIETNGTVDGVGVYGPALDYTIFEISHPMNSSDDLFDLNLEAGYEFYISITYKRIHNIEFFWPERVPAYTLRARRVMVARIPLDHVRAIMEDALEALINAIYAIFRTLSHDIFGLGGCAALVSQKQLN